MGLFFVEISQGKFSCAYPYTLDNLKEAIQMKVAQINRVMLERVEANF